MGGKKFRGSSFLKKRRLPVGFRNYNRLKQTLLSAVPDDTIPVAEEVEVSATASDPALDEPLPEPVLDEPIALKDNNGLPYAPKGELKRILVDPDHLMNQCLTFPHDRPSIFECEKKKINIEKIMSTGFITTWIVKCDGCKVTQKITSEDGKKWNSNNNLPVATLNAGIGYAEAAQFMAGLGVLLPSESRYLPRLRSINVKVKELAVTSMIKAGVEEKRLAVERGDVDKDGRPFITVIVDGCWGKRSYGNHYSASTGAGIIVGLATRKVLFYGVRNRHCAICVKIERKGLQHYNHKCFKNWDKNKAPNAMESDILCEGFRRSIDDHELVYKFYVGDGDSSFSNTLKKLKPYGDDTVIEKVECYNHLLRRFCGKLMEIQKNTAFKVYLRQMLMKARCNRTIRKIVAAAIKEKGSAADLQKEIEKVRNHVIGQHSSCTKPDCDGKPTAEELKGTKFKSHVERAFGRLLHHAGSLVQGCTNNPAEQVNSLINKYLGGRRIHYGQSDTYETKVAVAVIQYNETNFLNSIAAFLELDPGTPSARLTRLRMQRKVQNDKREKARKTLTFPEDEDYGNPSSPKSPKYISVAVLKSPDKVVHNQTNVDISPTKVDHSYFTGFTK